MNTPNRNEVQTQPGDALLIVDVQKDFLPGGSLAVPRGDEVVTALNSYLQIFAARSLPVYATRDWHPGAVATTSRALRLPCGDRRCVAQAGGTG